jgi:AcrR family transcriptional regulator
MSDYVVCFGANVNNQSPPVRSQANTTGPAVREREAPLSAAKVDRRVRRTRELLRRALFSLVQEQGYGRITVQDIIDRADIGRSTFYAHYRDKDDLLLSGFQDIRSALAAEGAAAEQAAGATSQFLQPLLVVFRHVEGHRHVWQPLTRKGGAEVVTRIMRDNVTDLIRAHLRSQFPGLGRNQPQLEAAVQFVASACIGLLLWWLDNDVPYSAEELYTVFRRLTTQDVRRFLTST